MSAEQSMACRFASANPYALLAADGESGADTESSSGSESSSAKSSSAESSSADARLGVLDLYNDM